MAFLSVARSFRTSRVSSNRPLNAWKMSSLKTLGSVLYMDEWEHYKNIHLKVSSQRKLKLLWILGTTKFTWIWIDWLLHSKCINIQTYIIGHYNPLVRIIDLVSHTAYVVCVNFIHKWRGTYSLKSTPNDRFFENLLWQFIFTLRVFARNLLRVNRRRNTFGISFWCLA